MQVYSTPGVGFAGGMPRIQGSDTGAVDFPLKTTLPRHMTPVNQPPSPERVSEGFGHALQEAVRRVEGLDNNAQQLTAKSVYAPDEVDAHEVVLAAEKARFALNLTKTLADGFVRTYRELTNPR
ncbi:MAG: flagellar hook-basal body complex protein FliE [Leptospiraceae bacterium]|nr:flagellar hook-basal body complex protein FliE [Leptospiraceae bacterium]MCB1319025.1 flagellar hook-basal body complex protein FliE [Leptospiraceae bacterium]